MPEATAKFHGITNEHCEKYGLPIRTALAIMKAMATSLGEPVTIVAHNWVYDLKRIQHETGLLGVDDFVGRMPSICTMKMLTDHMKLPGKYGKYKWPKLQEAHEFFLGCKFEDAHDAMADIRAMLRVLKEVMVKCPELLRAA